MTKTTILARGNQFAVNVLGESDAGTGVGGISNSGDGVDGQSTSGVGVSGNSTSNYGVYGESEQNEGVRGVSHSKDHAGVTGINHDGNIGVYGESRSKDHAGVTGVNLAGGPGVSAATATFDNVEVTGDIRLSNKDCAEDFDLAGDQQIEPGTVMVFDEASKLQPSYGPYDKKVAGVVSGAGDYKPAVVLGREQSNLRRAPIALMGRVYCKVDASYSPIEVGDLLTTSATEGHAMKLADPLQGFGASIGKALRRLESGQGLIPILVALQ